MPSFHLAAGARKLPQTLSGDDVRKLLAQPNSQKPLGIRDQAMLELLYATGLRVSELITLQMQQINFQGNFLTVKGKGSKMRAVPFGKWARQKLLDYIKKHKTATVQRQIQRFCIYQSLGTAIDAAGILETHSRSCFGSRRRKTSNAAHPASFVCHPSARRRRRSALRAIDARPCGYFDDANLHPREWR